MSEGEFNFEPTAPKKAKRKKQARPEPPPRAPKDPRGETLGQCCECEWWKGVAYIGTPGDMRCYCELCADRMAYRSGMRRMPEFYTPGLYVI